MDLCINIILNSVGTAYFVRHLHYNIYFSLCQYSKTKLHNLPLALRITSGDGYCEKTDELLAKYFTFVCGYAIMAANGTAPDGAV